MVSLTVGLEREKVIFQLLENVRGTPGPDSCLISLSPLWPPGSTQVLSFDLQEPTSHPPAGQIFSPICWARVSDTVVPLF